MKTKIWITALLAMAAFGCSDGKLATLPLTVESFTATPAEIKAGESVTLKWVVKENTPIPGVVAIDITSNDPQNAHLGTFDKLEGEASVAGLAQNTTFTLTAIKALKEEITADQAVVLANETPLPDEAEKPETPEEPKVCQEGAQICVTTATASVVVSSPTPEENPPPSSAELSFQSCYADKLNLTRGESTLLHWKTVPVEGTSVAIQAEPEGDPIQLVENCNVDSTAKAVLESKPAETFSGKGCALARPDTTTVYTFTATNGEAKAKCSATVKVGGEKAEAPAIETFSVSDDGDGTYEVDSYPAKGLKVKWSATPDSAKVTITAEPAENVLPESGELGGSSSGETTITVTGDATLTITAKTEDGQTATAKITITTKAPGMPGGVISSSDVTFNLPQTPVLFAGENVKASWNVGGPFASKVTTVKLMGPDGSVLGSGAASGAIAFSATTAGQYSLRLEGPQNMVLATDKPIVRFMQVVALKKQKGGAVVRTTEKPVYLGFDGASINHTVGKEAVSITIAKEDAQGSFEELPSIELTDLIMPALGGDNKRFFTEAIQNYPVNAIAVDPSNPERVVVGTSGAVILLPGGKGEPKLLSEVGVYSFQQKYPGSHFTCFGKTQKGIKPRDVEGAQLVSLGQVCDLAISGDVLYVATDIGLFYRKGVDSNEPWTVAGRNERVVLEGALVNDVEVAMNGVLAASNKGVFYQAGSSNQWSELNQGLSEKVIYAIAASQDGQKLVAGTTGGIYACSVNEALACNWEKAAGAVKGIVYAVKVDTKDPNTIYVGTDEGLFLTRDGGASFQNLAEGAVVRSISVRYLANEDNTVNFGIFVGTEQGLRAATAKIAAPAAN